MPILSAALVGVLAVLPDPPPSRALLLELTRQPRLAGTSGSRWGARFVARVLSEAGWEVELDERVVLLSLPRKLRVAGFAGGGIDEPLFERRERFDPDARPPGDVPPFNAWTAEGTVRAPVVDVGYGLRGDYQELSAAGLDPRGCVALARYGKSYRGVKVELAAEAGCVGVLLFSDPQDDGAERGPVWPDGPWMPDWAVQRGSISRVETAPGDPSTPGWPSPPPDRPGRRLGRGEIEAALPRIPCLPIPAREALALRAHLSRRTVGAKSEDEDADTGARPVGPGPVEALLAVEAPRDYRTIVNVVARMPGASENAVIAGNHRDAWVRGAHDAGGGTVALLRAAQHLSERRAAGWRPPNGIVLCFWDAEEPGLIGSTEWAEANAAWLVEHALAYVNGDTVVSGASFHGAAGSPGLLGALRRALQRVPAIADEGSLWDGWVAQAGDGGPRLGLPGSGSDFAAFLHHLNLPVLDIGFGGSSGGQYHTRFDDFEQVERHLDPGFVGHELAGRFLAELLAEIADGGAASFDEAEAAGELARLAREQSEWLGAEPAERLAGGFDALAGALRAAGGAAWLGDERFYRCLAAEGGLPGRPWFENRLWAPGLETGYSSETFPTLRAAQRAGAAELEAELRSLFEALRQIERLRAGERAPQGQ